MKVSPDMQSNYDYDDYEFLLLYYYRYFYFFLLAALFELLFPKDFALHLDASRTLYS